MVHGQPWLHTAGHACVDRADLVFDHLQVPLYSPTTAAPLLGAAILLLAALHSNPILPAKPSTRTCGVSPNERTNAATSASPRAAAQRRRASSAACTSTPGSADMALIHAR